MTSKLKIDDIIEKYFSLNQLDELLCINLANEAFNKYDFDIYFDELKAYFLQIASNQESTHQDQQIIDLKKESLNHLISYLYQQKHTKKQLILFRCINKLALTKCLEVKLICEAILINLVKYFNQISSYIWCKSFEYLKKFIEILDYKSCRDVFKILLDVVKHLSNKNNSKLPELSANEVDLPSNDTKIEALYDTIKFLLDRDLYFLPSYLAINEIKSVINKDAYHERFHYLLNNFTESFVPIAHLLSVVCRDGLLPVVGFSNLYSTYTVWKFHSVSCKFLPNGPLPYFRVQHISKIQHDLFAYILRQNVSHSLILNLFGQSSKYKQRILALEDEFVFTLIDTMKKTQELSNLADIYRIWNNLSNSLINLMLNPNINITNLINQLLNKLKNDKFDSSKSRDWLMWLFFQLISTTRYLSKNSQQQQQQQQKANIENEFSGVLDLYDLLYKNDDDFIQDQFDYNDFNSIIKMSILSIWIILNKKQNNRIILPNKLNRHINLLEDIVQSQNRDDNALAIWLNSYFGDNELLKVPLHFLHEKIGHVQVTQQQNVDHQPPVSTQFIQALCSNLKLQAINLLTIHLSIKQGRSTLTYIPPCMVDSYVKLCTQDGGIFIQLFQQLFNTLLNPQNIANLAINHYYYQHVNIMLEIIAFRVTNFSFTARSTFLTIINSHFSDNEQIKNVNLLKYPQIYINCQCALLKLLQGFSGSDLYELLTSIYGNTKYAAGYLINTELEEINKVSIMLIARAVKLTSNDLNPNYENKEREDKIKDLLQKILETTPIYFTQNTLDTFPQFMSNYLQEAKNKYLLNESSNSMYKQRLERQVFDDFKKLKECQIDKQVSDLFQNSQFSTFLCVLYKVIEDEHNTSQQHYLNLMLYYLNSYLEIRSLTPLIRVLCDYLVILASKSQHDVDNAVNQLQRIFNYNVITFDRFLFVLMLRSYDEPDMRNVFNLLNTLVIKNHEYENRILSYQNYWNEYCLNDEWNPNLQSRYLYDFPDKFMYDNLRLKLNHQVRDNYLVAYYSNIYTRLISIMDIFNYRLIETSECSNGLCDNFIQVFSCLFKHHPNPVAFVYSTLINYQNKIDPESIAKKRQLVLMLNSSLKTESPVFTERFKQYLIMNTNEYIDLDVSYYQSLLSLLVQRMLDKDEAYYELGKIEFNNPSCYMLYMILIELISLPFFIQNFDETSICRSIFDLFLTNFVGSQNSIDKETVYWINAAGLLMANLPETYSYSIYEYLSQILVESDILKTNRMDLLNYFDIYLSAQNSLNNDEITLIIALFHSFLYHSNANNFQYFVKFIKETMIQHVKSETHFLFICKLIGPFLSKIHSENANLLIDLVNQLYDMVVVIDNTSETLYYQDTIVNFFYHLKYRHTGESIKEKVNDIMPKLKPELRKRFKYIIPELNHH